MQEKFVVTGMTCAACSAHVEKAAGQLPGVNSAVVNLMLGTMLVDYDPEKVTAEQIISAVESGGYGAKRAADGKPTRNTAPACRTPVRRQGAPSQ